MGVKSFFTGGGEKGFKAEGAADRKYNNASMFGIGNRLGARDTGMRGSKDAPIYDFSGVGQSVGKGQAIQDYDFSGLDQAAGTFKNPSLFGQGYNPYQFNFAGLPKQYADEQYAAGSKNVRREGTANLKQLQESIGPRNKALLFKSAQNSQRDTLERLAQLNSGIRSSMMEKQADFGRAQQQAQAGENFNIAKTGSDENYRNAQSLADTSAQKIGFESDITQRERDYQDKALQYLLDMYKTHLTTRRGAKTGPDEGAIGQAAPDSVAFSL